ncbi:MAG: hypothetical protein JWM72_4718 [Actinomycetia bacterium]|nr:hypothetical protein [Actinomycetes bacterium]
MKQYEQSSPGWAGTGHPPNGGARARPQRGQYRESLTWGWYAVMHAPDLPIGTRRAGARSGNMRCSITRADRSARRHEDSCRIARYGASPTGTSVAMPTAL